ncbi:hypothetical protein AgCh_011871 [Apium graveolens]
MNKTKLPIRKRLGNVPQFSGSVDAAVAEVGATNRLGATWCVCKPGLNETVLQKSIDYACGSGADCTQIHQKGACYNPDTVPAHCNYAVNSYFQRKAQASGSCDFAGVAIISTSDPKFSGPYTERDSESLDDDVASRRRAHEDEIQRLKRDLEAHLAPIPPLPPRRRNPPPIIDLDGPQQRRVVVPRADPSDILPLGDPDDPTPTFTEDIMNVHISRKFKMPTIKAYYGTGDPANHGTRDEFFKMSLAKSRPESMLQLQDRAGKYIKVEESMRKTVVNNEPAGGKKRKTDLEYIAKDKYPRTEQSNDSTPKKGGLE